MRLTPASWEFKREKWKIAALTPLMILGLGSAAIFFLGLITLLSQQASFHVFSRQQKAFSADPDGFGWIATVGRSNYGVDVVLATPQDAFSRTFIDTFGSSPALMNTGNALCELSFSRESLVSSFAGGRELDVNMWARGVMVHELAHCLDIQRDFAGQAGVWSNVLSIAPHDRHSVNSGATHYQVAAYRVSTQVWREAVADIMAVGFWRLHLNPREAEGYIETLRKKRTAGIDDPGHATTCWIDVASSATVPVSIETIFLWADKLRAGATCRTG